MALIQVQACKCNRCGHVWLPRDDGELPLFCAKCKTAYWNRGEASSLKAKRGGKTQK